MAIKESEKLSNKEEKLSNKEQGKTNKYNSSDSYNMNNMNNMNSQSGQSSKAIAPSVSAMPKPIQAVPKTLGSQMAMPEKYKPAEMPSPEKMAEQFEKIKTKLDDLKKKLAKKYNFLISLSILPANTSIIFEEDEGIPKEISDTKPLHLMMLIPEEQYKNVPKIKQEIIKLAKESGQNLWVHIKTPVDLNNYGLDSKYEFLEAIGVSFPLYDKGFLGALRVASIHKSLVLRKFEKYVASYVIGGSLIRGTADKDSDVDTFVIIDDTDVKRMPRIELLEKLRGIIYDYIREATAMAGVKNILNVQVYLLTDFWQSVKDAHPVMFTFIRDGVPLYDRGTFLPWKLLLKMGRIKPSPEAIDLFMKSGEQTDDFVKRRLLDAMVDVFWGVVTPTQALMMLAGEAPPVPKTIVEDAKKVFVEKEKLMSIDEMKILEKIVKLYKDYEHGKLKEIPGKEVDELLKESNEYIKKLKALREKLDKSMQEKSLENLHDELLKLLKTLLGDKPHDELIKDFESKLVRKGKIQQRFLNVIKEVSEAKKKIKAGKLNSKEADAVKRDAIELTNSLVEYAQRSELVKSQKDVIEIVYKGRKAELVLMGADNYIVEGSSIKKFSGGKLAPADKKEFEDALSKHRERSHKIPSDIFAILKKELGDFELVI